ncbi:shikimate dehydrogenase [Frateuria soli]|uniref:shikimate dehydrogenase n=1 Tax=Frateuria soli TaxID=1542730 RepID=UPI001E5FFEA1|nr:shikimate dehydrogenase [Frateuria soli]UGB38109.1 shikimate dehydrogenase [Frateuria soli]
MPHGTDLLPPRYAVFGHPVGHSLSPAIHRMFGEQCGVALEYTAIDVTPAAFDDAVRRFLAHAHGANVTLPHKAAALALADECSAAARRAGSANVLTRLPDGRLAAHNTDGAGLVRDLTGRQQCALRGRRVLLLGAGGAARGVAWDLLDAGVGELTIVNRTPDTAAALAGALGVARVRARYWQDLAELGSFDLIVHATSAGVLGQPLVLPHGLATAQTVGYDLSYGSAAQSFLAWARAAGVRTACDGLGMLVEQAADAFVLWHGRRPDTDPVYAHLRTTGA